MIEQAPPRVLSGQLVTYELDLGHPEDSGTDDRPPRRVRAGPMLALLAFAVGLALGTAASVQRHGDGTTAAQRAEVSLVAALDPTVTLQSRAYVVTVHNAGPLPVQVDRPRLTAPGYADAAEPGTATRDIQPGTWERLTAPVGEPVCPPPAALSGEARFTALVTATDGSTRIADVPLLDNQATLDNARYTDCATLLNPEQAVAIWIEAKPQVDSPTVTATLQISSWAREAVEVASIETDPGVEVEFSRELPFHVPAQSTLSVDLSIDASDCALLPDDGSGAIAYITTRYRTQTFAHEIWIEPIELMRAARCL